VSPDLRAFEADAAKPAFRLGASRGRWELVRVEWPWVYIKVRASDDRRFLLRFECTDYPQSPPTAGPWDEVTNAVLAVEQWPQGRGGRVSSVFRSNWKGGTALYLPCDRVSIQGHDNWRTEMPSKIWRPADGIVQYLELVHELLHCRDYVAADRAAA
jgi:hypothetical protein